MKKLFASLLAGILLLSASACGSEKTPAAENTAAAAQTQNGDAANIAADGAQTNAGKVLVVYFSAANRTNADAVSQATPMTDGTAATEYLAQFIQQTVGGDLAKIVPVTDYPTDYNGTADQAKDERDSDARPNFTLDVNPEEYDTIFIGYPIWWYRIPMVLDTFFERYDFSGKTIVPFNTHAGSGNGGTYSIIADYEPNARVLDGLAISGGSANSSLSDVQEWLAGLEL